MYNQTLSAWTQQIRNLQTTHTALAAEYHKNPTQKLRQKVIESGLCLNNTKDAAYLFLITT